MEAAPGFEPGVRILQTLALPLGYAANKKKANIILYLSLIHNFIEV